MRDLVIAAMGSFIGWISCMFDGGVDLMFDLVRLAIGSRSPLELAGTWLFLGIVIGCLCNTPLEFITLSLRWPPLDMDGSTDACLFIARGGGVVIVCLVLVPVFSNFQGLFGQLQSPPIVNHRCFLANLLVLLIRSVLRGSDCLLPSPMDALDMRVNIPLYL